VPGEGSSGLRGSFPGSGHPKATTEGVADWREHTTSAFDLVTSPGGHFCLTAHTDQIAPKITTTHAGLPAG
jgi:surfactin synthase thioesterase subunit